MLFRETDTLNPSIDRASWTPERDALLISTFNKHWKLWTKIVKTYSLGRTGLSAKNRYNSITPCNSGHTHYLSESTSTSSSATVAPITPSMSIRDGILMYIFPPQVVSLLIPRIFLLDVRRRRASRIPASISLQLKYFVVVLERKREWVRVP
ncbi:hypothetical protein BDZ89DRAFT_1152061 [Hymenopellis radicata]|nr:hypothetical protein BDZ89DRAFT_1152061 [Hymenopellis radicata]